MALDDATYKQHEAKLFEAIKSGDAVAALDAMIAIDTALNGESNFAVGGPMRFYREHDMKQFIERVKAGEGDCYNAVKLTDGDRKIRIWHNGGELSTEFASDSGDMAMWEEIGKNS